MSLIDRNGAKADLWQRAQDADQPIVPFEAVAEVLASRKGNQPVGVEIANTIRVEALAPYLSQLALIAIAFPAFSDGRGFSIARQIRRAGFTGTLRAVGPLIVDQFAYALACGFDEVELPLASAARQPAAQWVTALGQISQTYQRSYEAGGNILNQRRAARGKSTS